jgi:hypothetical protein
VIYRPAGSKSDATAVIIIAAQTGWSTKTVRVIAIKERVRIIIRAIRTLPGLNPFG